MTATTENLIRFRLVEQFRSECLLAALEHAGALLACAPRLFPLYTQRDKSKCIDVYRLLDIGFHARVACVDSVSHGPTLVVPGHDDANAIGWTHEVLVSHLPGYFDGEYGLLDLVLCRWTTNGRPSLYGRL